MNEKRDAIRLAHEIRRNASVMGAAARFLIIFSLLLTCLVVFRPHAARGADSDRREALIETLPKGDRFDNDGFSYALLPTLRAQKAAPSSQAGDPIEQKGRFSVFSPNRIEPTSVCMTSGSTGENVKTYPVVLNLETKSIGIITGHLWLKLKDLQDASAIADGYHLALSFTNTGMETAFYDIPEDMDILKLRNQLTADPRVVRVTLDMVDRIRLPQ